MRGAGKAAGGILSYFTRHGTAANLLLIAMLTAGLLAFPNMRAQFFPDVVVDDLSVSVTWSGAGAVDVDTGITQVLEPVLLAVEGVTGSQATSREGRATIRIEFTPGYDIDRGAEDVQLALDATTNLPDGAETPTIRRGGWRDRVTDAVIAGPVGVDQLARFADGFAAALFAEGVTQVSVQGVAAPGIIVTVPSLSLIEHDIGLADIARRIAQQATGDPAGDIGQGARLRTGSAQRNADQIAAMVLRSGTDGANLTVGDVALVRTEGIDMARAYFVGDDPAIKLRIERTADGDAIGLQETVERVAQAFGTEMPEGVSISLTNGRADLISGRLDILLDNGLTGLLLVVALLFLFLNARTAFWVAFGIPVAMLAAIALMYAVGITINMISLFALIITLGIVVDDAIVVGEHADFRVRQLGEHPTVAAERAAQRMFSPVFSATITTIIAFFGLVIIGGRFGDLISDIPFTVIVVLAASLVECFLILPHHLSRAMAHAAKDHWYDWPSRTVNRGFDWMRDRLFRPLMWLVITARYPVLALAILLLASQVAMFVRDDVTWRFFNAPEQSQVTGNFAMLPGATRDDSLAMMREMQRAAEELGAQYEAEHGTNPLRFMIAEVGGNAGRPISGADTKDPDQLGAVTIELIDADSRPYSSGAFVRALQDAIVQHPMAETVSFRSWGSGPGGDNLDIQIFGSGSAGLKRAAEALKTELGQYAEITGLEDTLAYDKQELVLELTAQGQALGLNIDSLGAVLRARLGGIEAASFPDGSRTATIRVELPANERLADFLDRTQVRTAQGAYVPLADVVTVSSRTGFATIRREDGVQLISVLGDLDDDDAARASEIQAIITGDILPRIESDHAVQTRLSGQSEQERQFLNDARLGLILVLLGIYLTLAWIFASWTRPAVVMAIIPFALVGTIFGHYVWDIPLSMFTVVGLIGMVGIIINDSIVLVTAVDEYAQTRGLVPAIIDGTADRLRPVMLTTLTTVLGLTPLLYEGSNQAEFLKPTVVTLVFGLGFGMFLVLLVVPAIMAMQADIARQWTALRRAVRAPRWAMRLPVIAGVGGAMLLFTVTLLPTIGSVPWGVVGSGAPTGLFLAGTAVWLLAIYCAAALFSAARKRSL